MNFTIDYLSWLEKSNSTAVEESDTFLCVLKKWGIEFQLVGILGDIYQGTLNIIYPTAT